MSLSRWYILGSVFLFACNGPEMVMVPESCPGGECVKAFMLDVAEVTQGNFQKVMGYNPSTGPECGSDCPVESVEWTEAVAYCSKLGKRLPSSKEWEIAARAGMEDIGTNPGTSLEDQAWFSENAEGQVHSVMELEPNAFGLYDMLGNVAEWTSDPYEAGEGKLRTVRGGHWSSPPSDLKFSVKKGYMESDRGELLGFRCAQSL